MVRRLVACLILLACCQPSLAGSNPSAPLGTNLNAVNDFSDEFPFVNVMKSARDWIPGNAAGCFDCREPGSNPSCNAPNACPVIINRDADGYATSLEPNQVLTTILHAGGTPGRLPAGNYTLRFDGAGTIQMLGASVVNQTSNEIVFNVASSTGNNIGFRLTAVTVGNHIRNARVLPPGGVCSNDSHRFCDASSPCDAGNTCNAFTSGSVAETQLFHPRFLKNYEPYRLLRFMDWMGTNSSQVSAVADYPTAASAFWGRVPISVLAELGNRLQSDIWINIPHKASNALVDQFATTLRDQFTPDRRVYVEYGNENWNGIFQQNVEIPRQFCPNFADLAVGCQDDGVPGNGIACERNPVTFSLGNAQGPCFQALVRAWGDRSTEIFARFDTAFGSSARNRTVRVIAAQAANADLGRQVLTRTATGQAFTVASKTDVYASAPYFGTEYCTPDSGVNPDTSPAVYASVGAFLDHVEANALPRAVGFMTSSKNMLNTNFPGSGIRHIAYEGGQHFAGIGGFTFNNTCNTIFDAANRNSRMESIYRSYLSSWKLNGDEFTHFYNTGRWGVFGYWGALEFQDQNLSTSPKYQALTGHSTANPCHWPNCTQTGSNVVDPLFGDSFEGSPAPTCTPAQLLVDGGLEASDPNTAANPNWASTSTNFGSAICTSATCPDDAGTALPRTGSAWAWFGGTANAETSTLTQSVQIPSGSPRFLNVFLRRGFVSTPFNAELRVKVDGTTVQTFDEPSSAEAGYTVRSVDLSSFANGATHSIQFEYVNPSGSGKSNFVVDDMSVTCTAGG
ncbi:hypothetical protein C7S18_18285 [Ahniella affigens]|uniref:Uncharacterized protein n=1 Tax=Ahniella affigens TaxID=2021234 RepID=A0A2P1PW50_9GAMM|nr:hypothetical protein [Ahniella affigens]AVP99004.1 hypothetical protein C7S18_18285 [Ahniella affigens]